MDPPVVQQGLRRRATENIIGAGTGTSHSRVNSFSLDTTNTTKPTTDVIVHQVASTDTLAGVALKYGIQVSALRKHNRLWHNDSIHHRRTVYIPLAYCASGSGSVPVTRSPSLDSDRCSQPNDESTNDDNEKLNNNYSNSSVTQIPTAELTYFPPPANESALVEPSSPSKMQSFRQQQSPSPPSTIPQEPLGQSTMAAMWSSVATTIRSTNLQSIGNRIADDLDLDLSKTWIPNIVRRESSRQKPKDYNKTSPQQSPTTQNNSQTSSLSPLRKRPPAYLDPVNSNKNSSNSGFEQELRTL